MNTTEKKLAEHLFRRKYGEILAALLRSFGYELFDLAEGAVQTAFQRALEKWPFTGTPRNPEGWLYQVARNALLEALRRRKLSNEKIQSLEPDPTPYAQATQDVFAEIDYHLDDLATMILLCCNPQISPKAQVCWTLKTACGFSVQEIARALGVGQENIKKTITRARHTMSQDPDVVNGLDPDRIAHRFPVVMETLYAMFTEGYSASSGESQLRREVAEEALRLADVMLESTVVHQAYKGELEALMALMLFQFARFDARVGDGGMPVRLAEQDRGKWSQDMIQAGFAALEQSIQSGTLGSYHIEARIAAEHSSSKAFEETDWQKILDLYNQLVSIKDTDQVRLNRIVAVQFALGASAAMHELQMLDRDDSSDGAVFFPRSFLYHAVKAQLYDALAQHGEALNEWNQAKKSAPTAADRSFVEAQIKSCLR